MDKDVVELRRERQAAFTYERKVHVLGMSLYGNRPAQFWEQWGGPKAGDFYTLTRPTLELFHIARVEDGMVYIVNCLLDPETVQESGFPLDTFLTEGFGVNRIYVHPLVFTIGE